MEFTTCLWFNGNAREAAHFYTSIFPDSHIDDNWIAPTDTPGNKQGEEIVEKLNCGPPFKAINGLPNILKFTTISSPCLLPGVSVGAIQ